MNRGIQASTWQIKLMAENLENINQIKKYRTIQNNIKYKSNYNHIIGWESWKYKALHRQEQNDKETIEEKTKSLHFYYFIQNSHSFLYYLVAAFINHLKWMNYHGWYGQKVLPEKKRDSSLFCGIGWDWIAC